MADTVSYEISKKLGVIGRSDNGWQKEVNLVKWNNGITKLDIRDWDPDGGRMRKGVTLSRGELFGLYKILKNFNFNEVEEYKERKAKDAPKEDLAEVPEEIEIPECELSVEKE